MKKKLDENATNPLGVGGLENFLFQLGRKLFFEEQEMGADSDHIHESNSSQGCPANVAETPARKSGKNEFGHRRDYAAA